MTPESFSKSIKENKLPKIAVLYGTSEFQIENSLDRIMKMAESHKIEYDIINFEENGLGEVFLNVSETSLFSKQKIIFVKDSVFLGTSAKILENEQEQLIKYLEKPNPDVNLIFVNNDKALDKRKKINKQLIAKAETVILNGYSNDKIRHIFNAQIKKRQLDIDQESMTYFMKSIGEDYDLFINEFQKLAIYGLNNSIGISEIKELMPPKIEHQIFEITDYFFNNGNNEKLIARYEELIVSGTEPLAIIGLLLQNIRQIIQIKILKMKGLNGSLIASKLKLNPYVVKIKDKQGANITFNRLKQLNQGLYELQRDFKIGIVQDLIPSLEIFLIKTKNQLI